ncbi:flavodoxin family protein [Desulfofustis glycolicus]|uniref:NADPH-dependent FMN reductase n=1 Tax=Desulfofustis glycolicus DSM 9705 TaxID=1121409 RepID=A0A1M5YG14_9BACT|nr:flavodoxin family protein [Desulfofustis glycolicus]SHI11001.1 NADPH-dependent FMN reductase [Desulfofustis glycolicus DSM 9705]
MKILAFNGSPRLNGNTATMLEYAISGARENGAEVELFNLYKMQFSGCISCFSCKRLDKERPIVCAVIDDLKPVLEKVSEIDGLLIATPVYYGCESAATRAFIERLCFPYLNYADYTTSHFPRRIPVGLIYTMNVPSELFEAMGYDVTLGRTRETLEREFGSCKMVLANNTMQYTDYSLYEANATGEEKKAYRDAHFSNDCQNARQLGEQLASGKVFNA